MGFSARFIFVTGCSALLAWGGCIGSEPVAATDSRGGDAAVRDDANAPFDASPAPDAEPVTYCTGKAAHEFCADFDRSLDPRVGWSGASQKGTCAFSTTDRDHVSKPRAARFLCQGQGLGSAVLSRTSQLAGGSLVRAEYDLKVSAQTRDSDTFGVMGIAQNGAYLFSLARLAGTDAAWVLYNAAGRADAGEFALPLTIAAPKGVWVHVAVELTFARSADVGRVQVWFDEKLALDAHVPTALEERTESASITFGAFAFDTAIELADVMVDNVLIDAQPKLR